MSGPARASGFKAALGPFLAANPFPNPHTIGFFYREKMRAIHRVAPDERLDRILEIGGGRGGLTGLLYPAAEIVNVDMDPSFGTVAVNRGARTRFVAGDATALPFSDGAFDAVTMFDVLEHIPDHERATAEARRVLRPGGVLMASSPHTRWRYPYYRVLGPIAPHEDELFAEWGHVRRGYTLEDLDRLAALPRERWATFISPVTALAHDVSFARLPLPVRRLAIAALAPLTWLGYAAHRPHARGTETAVAWRKGARDG
jgi:SAM-dependent methyltransferase